MDQWPLPHVKAKKLISGKNLEYSAHSEMAESWAERWFWIKEGAPGITTWPTCFFCSILRMIKENCGSEQNGGYPLTDLTRPGAQFLWKKRHKKTFLSYPKYALRIRTPGDLIPKGNSGKKSIIEKNHSYQLQGQTISEVFLCMNPI